MSVTDATIENLAEVFCMLSKLEHKALYLESLKSLARIAQSELIYQMQLDFTLATTGQPLKH